MLEVRMTSFSSDSASALVSVLIIIVVITLVAGSVLAYATLQHRFFARDVHRLEARYAAEAAIYEALAGLHDEGGPVSLAFGHGAFGEAVVTRHGAFRKIEGEGRRGRQAVRINVIAGLTPPEPFRDAVHTSDPHAGLILAGSTRITGDVRTASADLRTESFRAQPFTGAFEGEAKPNDFALHLSDQVDRLLAAFEAMLADGEAEPGASGARVIEGDAELSCAGASEDELPAVIIIRGSVTIPAGCALAPATAVVSAGTGRVAGPVEAPHLVLYAREGIVLDAGTRATGQFFTEGTIALAAHSYLTYPSLLYSTGGLVVDPDTPYVHLDAGATLDGFVIVPQLAEPGHRMAGDVVIDRDAVVRGAVVSAQSTTLHGTVHGSVFTGHFRFYAAPTVYVNWLRDAVVDVTARPEPFALPLFLAGQGRPVVVDWWEEG